jgi:hypothetical protein
VAEATRRAGAWLEAAGHQQQQQQAAGAAATMVAP